MVVTVMAGHTHKQSHREHEHHPHAVYRQPHYAIPGAVLVKAWLAGVRSITLVLQVALRQGMPLACIRLHHQDRPMLIIMTMRVISLTNPVGARCEVHRCEVHDDWFVCAASKASRASQAFRASDITHNVQLEQRNVPSSSP